VVLLLPLMHRTWLAGHLQEWFLVDVGAPLAAALAVAAFWKQAIGVSGPYISMLVSFGLLLLLTALAAASAAPQVRVLLAQRFLHAPQPRGGM
jgi:hypothetical protein